MEKIDVKEFKGLYTNLLDNSANYSVFADMDKVKVNKRYLESQEYKTEEVGKAEIRNVVESKVVYLDDDRWWYKDKVSQYSPDYQKHYVIFTNTRIKVYKDNFDVPILEQSLTGYIKSFELNGVLRILTSKGIFNLQYKRINNVKTLLCLQVNNGLINDTLKSSVATSVVQEVDPEIRFEVVPQAQIYWLHSSLSGDGLSESKYRISVFDVVDGIERYEAYVGTIYLIRVLTNIFNIPTQGFYDWQNTTTFIGVPVDIVGGQIKINITSLNWTHVMKSQNGAFSNFWQINPDPSLGLPDWLYVDHNYVFQFGYNSLNIQNFLLKFKATQPLTTTTIPSPFTQYEPVFLSEFLDWISNPNVKHRIIGTFNLNPTDYGFEVTAGNAELLGNFIQTVVINGNEESVIAYGKISTPVSSTRVIYSVEPIKDLSALATHTKLYVGFGNIPEKYELVKTVELYKGDSFSYKEFFGYLDLSGILLSNMLAIYGDIKNFSYITEGNDYCLVNNIGFLVKGGTVYYSPNDTSNAIFYKNRYIPNVYGDALVNIGGMLGIIRYNKDVTLISLQVIENEIYFKVYDTVGYVITGKNQYLEIPDGLLLSLKDGLYLVTPQERQLLSEPVNDIFEDGTIPKLLYDDFNRRIMVQKGDDTYVFDLINKVWLKFKRLKLSNIAFDGNDIITIEGSSFAKVNLVNGAEGYLKFHQSNLGSEKIAKTLCGLRIDMEGSLTMLKTSSCHYEPPTASTSQLRRVEEYYFKFSDQVPQVNMGFELKFNGKIYSMEILYNLVGEFPKNLLEV